MIMLMKYFMVVHINTMINFSAQVKLGANLFRPICKKVGCFFEGGLTVMSGMFKIHL